MPTHAMAETYADIVQEVRDASLAIGEIAEVAGVNDRQVHHWVAGTHRPQHGAREALLDLRYVVKQLLEVYRPQGVEIWLHSRNPELEGERPIDLLKSHDFPAVLNAIERLKGGAV